MSKAGQEFMGKLVSHLYFFDNRVEAVAVQGQSRGIQVVVRSRNKSVFYLHYTDAQMETQVRHDALIQAAADSIRSGLTVMEG